MKHIRSALVVTLIGLLFLLTPHNTLAGHDNPATCLSMDYHIEKMTTKNPTATTALLSVEALEMFNKNYNAYPPVSDTLFTAVAISSKPDIANAYVGIEVGGCMQTGFSAEESWLRLMMIEGGWQAILESTRRTNNQGHKL